MKKKEMDYFSALYEVARVINASLEPARVLEKIVMSVARAMNLKAASIRLLDDREKKLVLGGAYGLSEDYIHKGPILVDESGVDKKALKGRTIYLKDAQTDKGFQYGDKARAEGIKSVLVVPLVVEKKAIGVLRVYSDQIREFHDKELQFLQAVADLSAIAIENARLHQLLQVRCELMAAHKYRIDDN
ncbi:MAG TPA: GAF domain-containing protein [Syntrophales bacterium]|nr:GAF domain-containing protein [Syntrophales bacterium]HON23623.1 GAF domain-containing protein [Syntrophales bacterium]HOU78228.1 GAF domain-containing protein [Syntrophales bacterium]HPC33243.1 GAF domain-containing protein [Syntrophales bacterium]HQG34517.1 GAF domain-containing protein [Syntrophales bacterium]